MNLTWSGRLLDRDVPICQYILLPLNLAVWPNDGKLIHAPATPETEMEARIITGKVASSIVQCRRLFLAASLDFDFCPQGVPIGVCAQQVEADP